MKTKLCDVCYYTTGNLVESQWRYGYTGGHKIDVCLAHKNWGKQFEGKAGFQQAVLDLWVGKFKEEAPTKKKTARKKVTTSRK